ncbi:hypothetical protein CDAR_196711 [Caerostris darwini]|uniref:Reverse transcriptase zinc-binding domain-containing protein n=1 Tax=Caerostris darwini TaxID=1538125 RepID=A0AAV4PXK0_9ARAC|nr:hypothetical protein CDAR_196711 [Caerostris darwini]
MKDLSNDRQTYWQTSCKGRAVYDICPKVSTKRLHGNFYLNQIYTGHGVIASYQNKFFNKDPKCICGHVLEGRQHIIYQCSKWRKIRTPSSQQTSPCHCQNSFNAKGSERPGGNLKTKT